MSLLCFRTGRTVRIGISLLSVLENWPESKDRAERLVCPITPLRERYQAGQPLNFTVGTITLRIHPGHVTKRFFTLFITSNPEIFFPSLPQMKRIAVSSDHPALELFGFVKRLSASFGQKEHTSHFICMPTLSMAVASIMAFSRTTIVRDSLSRVFSEYGRSSFSSSCTASCIVTGIQIPPISQTRTERLILPFLSAHQSCPSTAPRCGRARSFCS